MHPLLIVAEGKPIELQLFTLLTTIGVFLLFLWVASRLVWPRIVAGLDERDHKIHEEIERAELARKEAADSLSAQQDALNEARAEARDLIAQAKATAVATANELRARAEADLNETRLRATREIEKARETAVTELHAEASTLATMLASKILQREVSADDQTRLIEESLDEFAKSQG
jgi:F-type H+-transporting ATPase subunit b